MHRGNKLCPSHHVVELAFKNEAAWLVAVPVIQPCLTITERHIWPCSDSGDQRSAKNALFSKSSTPSKLMMACLLFNGWYYQGGMPLLIGRTLHDLPP